MTEYLSVKNWDEFQQYKDREPKWIKIYRSLLMDYKYEQLSDSEFGALVKIWLLASQMDNHIPNDPGFIQRKCGLSQKPNIDKYLQLDFLKVNGFVQDCTESYGNVLREEKIREETEKNIYDQTFDLFWLNYPNKKGKAAARKAWSKIKEPTKVIERMKETLPCQIESEAWTKNNGQFIPHPATYLNQGRWEDETI